MGKIDKEELHIIFKNIKDNNTQELNNLFNKYRKLIYGIAFSILKNKIDSEEIVQIVFMKIITLEKSKLPTTSEASWLYTLTKNETLNYIRKKKQEVSIETLYYISDDNDELSKIVDEDKYNRIISKLNEKEKEIVSLKIISNFSFKQISQILNIPMGTVQWRYYKAINTLKILISNLSMFIITTILLIKREVVKNNKKSTLVEKEEASNENKNEELPNKVETEKVEESKETMKGSVDREEIEDISNTENQNEVKQDIIVQTNEEIGKNIIDIAIFSIWIFLLITTITFIIIFIRKQQKK